MKNGDIREILKFHLRMVYEGDRCAAELLAPLKQASGSRQLKTLLGVYEEILAQRMKLLSLSCRRLGINAEGGSCRRAANFSREARDLIARGIDARSFEQAILIHLRERARDEVCDFRDLRANAEALNDPRLSEHLSKAEQLTSRWRELLEPPYEWGGERLVA